LQVKKYFEEIFSELVPGGSATLEFKFLNNGNGDEDPVGVAICPQFSQTQTEDADIASLSGGQKAIVSLAFIFAVQKTDPSPFYVLDEVDAALDGSHRRRVANWMVKQSCQFICTTFRHEFLAKANHFIGIQIRNHVSHAMIVSPEEAMNFIEDNSQE
jgi:chromosome segregation ATPase